MKLDLDEVIKEQNSIMKKNYPYDNSPDRYLHFATARMIKLYLLKRYALQQKRELKGKWVFNSEMDCMVCSICFTPMRYARIKDGHCSGCDALNG